MSANFNLLNVAESACVYDAEEIDHLIPAETLLTSSENFECSESDDRFLRGVAEARGIMEKENLTFDEARLQIVQMRMAEMGIDPSGMPTDSKIFTFEQVKPPSPKPKASRTIETSRTSNRTSPKAERSALTELHTTTLERSDSRPASPQTSGVGWGDFEDGGLEAWQFVPRDLEEGGLESSLDVSPSKSGPTKKPMWSDPSIVSLHSRLSGFAFLSLLLALPLETISGVQRSGDALWQSNIRTFLRTLLVGMTIIVLGFVLIIDGTDFRAMPEMMVQTGGNMGFPRP